MNTEPKSAIESKDLHELLDGFHNWPTSPLFVLGRVQVTEVFFADTRSDPSGNP